MAFSAVDYKDCCDRLLAATTPGVRKLLSRQMVGDIFRTTPYPPFIKQLIIALEALEREGKLYWVTCLWRTWEEQAKLFAFGRTDKTQGIKTTVGPGDSAHNYGIAADCAYDLDPDKAGLQPSWEKPWLRHYAEAAVAAGLDAGFFWENFFDGPHVQLNLRQHGLSPRKQLKAAYKKGGTVAVFNLLDTYSWAA